MKLQNMTVIFIIIMIPIILVVSYYIGLQINTITMQKNYTVKLQTAAKDSIQALEINTVEWNSASSNLADSKRRDVLAAINTFTTSLANGMGIGGAGKGRIQTYIPAIVYTMYDGYYIYSASWVKDQDTIEKDQNGKDVNYGRTQFDNNEIKYKGTSSYQYILKPYSPYSARYVNVNGNVDVTVNYTLDNYIRVYGKVGNGDKDKSVAKEGYLVVCDDDSVGVGKPSSKSITGIKYRGAEIKPETLKENVYADGKVGEYSYIYDQYDNKLYWDKEADPNKDGEKEGNYFSVDKYKKVYLQNALPEGDAGFSITNRFRKISIPVLQNNGEWTVLKVFQILNPEGGFKFYYEDSRGAFVEFTEAGILNRDNVERDKDYSAINYCVESYVFTQWVTKNLGNITVGDMQISTEDNIKSLKELTAEEQQYYGQYNNVDINEKIFDIKPNNNPDPENDTAYAESALAQHKKDIIINTIEKNLSQATAQAQEMNPNYEYRLPQLSYDEWEQALSNISIIAFMQGMPIGLKYYNNYAIATSTLNKEFVDPDELYFAGTGDQYYHQRQCEQATGSDYVGYRSIDYVAKSYEVEDGTTKSTKYYYPHANENNSTNSELECYYCLVNRSTYKNNGIWHGNLLYKNWPDSYYNALARERYMQLDEPGTYKPNVTVEKMTEPSTAVEYGREPVKYTVKIKNKGIVKDTITFADFWETGKIEIIGGITATSSNPERKEKIELKLSPDYQKDGVNYTGISAERIDIDKDEIITITYTAYLKGSLGENIKNTAIVYSYTNNNMILDRVEKNTTVKKTINAIKTEVKQKNVILVVDTSSSMGTYLRWETGKAFKAKVKKFVKDLQNEGIPVSQIKFNRIAYDNWTVNDDAFWTILPGTNYKSALEKTNNKIVDGKNNILVFFSDGDPTYPGTGFPGYTYDERGTTIFGTDNIAKKTWNGVESEISTIKGKGVTIYAIGFTNAQADADEDGKDEKNANFEGLQKVFVTKSTDKFINAKNQTDLLNAFDDIAKIITKELEIPDKYTAYNNKVEIQYVNEITSITIGDSNYTVEQAKNQGILVIDGEKGYLDLSKLNDENQLGLNIQINY